MGQFIEVEPNIKLYVEDIGKGKPVIFIHGWPVNHKMFEYQFIKLPEQGFRCIGIDLRGFGRSDAPWEGYEYDRLADDIKEVIDLLELEDAVLLGFSLGGAVAIRYMARHQGYGISRLVLAGAAAPSFAQRTDFPHGVPPEQVENLMVGTHLDRPQMLKEFGNKFVAKGTSASFAEWFHQLALAASAQGTLKAALSLRDEDLRGDLPQIRVPTAIFHGEKDQICGFELAELMHQSIPNAMLVHFEESGHGMLFDEPGKFNEELLRFIR